MSPGGNDSPAEAGDIWLLGVDSGGSGLRVALARRAAPGPPHDPGVPGGPPVRVGDPVTGPPVRTGGEGVEAAELAARVISAGGELLARAEAPPGTVPAGVCVGAAGFATLGTALRRDLPGALAAGFAIGSSPVPDTRLVLAADAVTGYAGALGERPGVVVAAGTGMIALGTDLAGWRRADGWGHLLGDCGSGAWIGRAGLEAALRALDGRPGGSAALLRCAEEEFGAAGELPSRLYPRPDRAAVLASFAPAVARCAAEPVADPRAREILREAAREIAATAAAALPESLRGAAHGKWAPGALPESGGSSGPGGPAPLLALTGGLPRLGSALTGPLREELARRLPGVREVSPAGDPLDGALLLADRAAAGGPTLPPAAGLLETGPLPQTPHSLHRNLPGRMPGYG
ncbi:N-acetylglucosamine kinase [Streptomyces sp. ST2-7A]|uniref:N-acetylglucosamine kinase n=1 Tax=Streptomyces sp. ST2-7A TaxID=2907214 RepID=UPI001F177B8F|nr:BadF/BadG/BcrA/BcrD ATPase family protein [Streptomyces sp. ST2-7A]MCE7079321.1 ATPase [Streptomyces sp. ST2-7A]